MRLFIIEFIHFLLRNLRYTIVQTERTWKDPPKASLY